MKRKSKYEFGSDSSGSGPHLRVRDEDDGELMTHRCRHGPFRAYDDLISPTRWASMVLVGPSVPRLRAGWLAGRLACCGFVRTVQILRTELGAGTRSGTYLCALHTHSELVTSLEDGGVGDHPTPWASVVPPIKKW